jgi:hypothetical protein
MQGFVLESQGQRKIVIQTGVAGIGDLPSYIAPAATFYDPGDGAYQDPNVAEDRIVIQTGERVAAACRPPANLVLDLDTAGSRWPV